MNNKQESLFALSPGDITVQIIPEWLENNDLVKLPEVSEGYTIPTRKFLLEEVDKEFCGVMEIASFFVNTKVHKDLIEELYENGTHFTIYVRKCYNSDDGCPKILKIYKDCTMYQQEFAVPEISSIIFSRYYFTNCPDPWEISQEKLDSLTPVNQYIYDYAVSKAIKDLNKDMKNLISETVERLLVTPRRSDI